MAQKTVTANGDAQLDTAEKKFGTASGLFDGTGDYLSMGSESDFDFGTTTDFTIDFWVRGEEQAREYPCILGNNIAAWGVGCLALSFDHTLRPDKLIVMCYDHGSPNFDVVTSTTNVNDGEWHHVEFNRSGDLFRLFINGIQEDSHDQSGGQLDFDFNANSGTRICQSGWDGDLGCFDGWIDEFRITKGLARHTSNFSVKTSAYSADVDTKLLLHCDGADESVDFIDSSVDIPQGRSFGTII